MYPIEIIPKPDYLKEIDLSILSKVYQIVLIRRSAVSLEETFDNSTKTITLKAFGSNPYKEVPNFSMNILNSFFNVVYIKFIAKGESSNIWNGTDKINIEDHFANVIEDSGCPIFYNYSDLNVENIPFEIPNLKEYKKALNTMPVDLDANGNRKFNGEIFVKHVPVILNYWHAELIVLDPNGDRIERSNDGLIAKKLKRMIVDNILVNGSINHPDPSTIPEFSRSYYFSP